jgi:SAM-dependent methyltransferase
MRRVGWPAKPRLPKIDPPSASFIASDEYTKLMSDHLPVTRNYGRHEAWTYTRSYQLRHHTFLTRLGVWRWRGMEEHRDRILQEVADPAKVVIDWGGAGCPLGMHSIVVDTMTVDAAGRPVRYASLLDLEVAPDVIFACHVLEHIEDLDGALAEASKVLKPGGRLIAFVPSYTNSHWQAGLHRDRGFGAHQWTFGLSSDPVPRSLPRYRDFDATLARHFTISLAEYCGDDSIVCFAYKPEAQPSRAGGLNIPAAVFPVR